MKNILSGLLLLLLTSLVAIAQPGDGAVQYLDYTSIQKYEIGGITVSGTNYYDNNVLIRQSGLRVGDELELPGEAIPDAMNALWKLGLFEDVKIAASRIVGEVVFLEIILQELPKLSKYKFFGARKAEIEDMRDQLPLISGRMLNENTLNNTEYIAKKYFVEKGFLNAEVTLKNIPDPDRSNSNILHITVDRGRKVKLRNIIFHGVENEFPRKLKKNMAETKEKSFFTLKAPWIILKDAFTSNPLHQLGNLSIGESMNYLDDKARFKLFATSKFLRDDYKVDRNALIHHYNTMGYRDAEILADTLYQIDDGNMDLHITINEGKKYYFRNISWSGNSKYEADRLDYTLNIPKGTTYNPELLQTRLYGDPTGRDISSLYMNEGHLFFNVNPEETLVGEDSIDLNMRVYEGPEAIINKIIVTGNDKTNEHVIRRSLYTSPGNKFRRSDLINSQREIANLGYFDAENIGINPIPNPADGTVDIEYSLAERPSDQLELSAGFGAGQFIGSLGVSFNNFSLKNMFNREAWRDRGLPAGDGQKLSVRFQSSGRRYQSLNASFTEPWLGGKRPNSLTVSVFRSRNATQDFTTNEFTSLLNNTGVGVSLGRRLRVPDDKFVLVNSLNYSYYKLIDWPTFIVDNGTFHNVHFGTTLSRSTVNQPIFPRSGNLVSLSVDVTPPWSSMINKDYANLDPAEKFKLVEYHKWKFKAEWYVELYDKLVLKTAGKFGLLGFFNEDIGHSPFERFQVGGSGLANPGDGFLAGTDIIALRGYEDFEVTLANEADRIKTGDQSQTDPYYSKFTAELRYLLSPSPTATIYALAFAEGANSWNSFDQFNPFQLKRSWGLGLRIFMPMFGMLGFDYGFGVDKLTTNGIQETGVGGYFNRYGTFSFILGFEPE